MEKIIIVSEEINGLGCYDWREIYNGDTNTEEQAIKRYCDGWSVDPDFVQAITINVKDIIN